MPEWNHKVYEQFGHQVRVRVCALCFRGDEILLVWHRGLKDNQHFVAPPGGGVQFGETAEQAMHREVKEETGLAVEKSQFLFVYEHVEPPLHAVELFFSAEVSADVPRIGIDPELNSDEQLIQKVGFTSPQEIRSEIIKGKNQFHQLIRHYQFPKELLSLRGYFKFDNKTRN
ncbi:NUDIX domain-containing protein [Tunicatimonas pelagia]|uniref:NUDIX domain-containing protein n=1 Tax=Tunicatimonas pelagia TaxID=931531 RepID=UPI002665DB41|nr:NUDIX hydrolase [Tunicatimonas pelagia]WKN45926.1 NUDIX hydrolase [Tunicatimonas pelagia]